MNREVHVRFCERFRGEIPIYLLDYLLCLFRFHLISSLFVSYLRKSKGLHKWRNVHSKSSSKALFKSIPTSYGVSFRTTPSFYCSFFCRFLFVRTSKFHPISMFFEHFVQIVYTIQIV